MYLSVKFSISTMAVITKHIAVKYHFFKEHIREEKGFRIVKIESEFQKADIFTKGLPMVDFERIRGLMMGW